MPRIVPSQVVEFIDQSFPWAANQQVEFGVNLLRQNSGELAGLLHLVEKIPEELLALNGADYGSFVCNVAAIGERLALWRAQAAPPELELVFVTGRRRLSPVRLIRDALSNCPDENPAAATTELNFIADQELRSSLRVDLAVIDRALSNGEWKAATVLAGSVIEALLLWALQQRDPTQATVAATTLVTNTTLARQPAVAFESWVLHEYIEVVAHLGIIRQRTAIQTRLAKDFRNLIHPGRALRLGQKCDRATALSAVAGMEHVVRDLTP